MNDYFNVTGTIGFTCDVCGRELQGCTWVNGMRFCAKCYQETFGNTNPFEKELRDKIAELMNRLAEKDARIEELEGQFAYECECNKEFVACQKENEQLKQQLAECEKESNDYVMFAIETNVDLKNRLTQAQKERELDNAFWKQECDSLQKALAEKEKEIKDLVEWGYNERKNADNWEKDCFIANQAKTDFAIEQLEKAVNTIYAYVLNLEEIQKLPIALNNYEIGFDKGRFKAVNIINQQIKELKEKK